MAENCAFEGGLVDPVGAWPGIGSEVVPRGFDRGMELVCVGSKGRSDHVVGASRLEPRETSENEVTGETVGGEHTDHTEITEHTELQGQATFRDGATAEETTPRAVTQKPDHTENEKAPAPPVHKLPLERRRWSRAPPTSR